MSLLLNEPRPTIWLAAGLYGLALLASTWPLLRGREYPRSLLLTLTTLGVLAQGWGLLMRGRAIGGCPISNAFELVQFVAWSVALLYLWVGPAFRTSLLGYFTSAFVLVLTLLGLLVPGWDGGAARAPSGPLIESHAALALFSYGAFGLLAVTSLMYLIQHYSLKHKRVARFFELLPSLYELERVNLRLLLLAAVLYSVAVGFGVAVWISHAGVIPTLKLLPTVLLWLGYASVLLMRWRHRWTASRLAWSCLSLFLVALVALWIVEVTRGGDAFHLS